MRLFRKRKPSIHIKHFIMKKILWLAVMSIGMLQAQTVIIENQETNGPIEMATISSNNPQLFAITKKEKQI